MLKHTIRSLRGTPGFTIIAVLTLSLGIGANTALGFEKFWLSPPEYFELQRITGH